MTNKPVQTNTPPWEVNELGAAAFRKGLIRNSALAGRVFMLALCVWREARGERNAGKRAVAQVVENRVSSSTYPDTYEKVITQRKQFSAFNKDDANSTKYPDMDSDVWEQCYVAACRVMFNADDYANGADHYHTKDIMPYWADIDKEVGVIGNHVFYKFGHDVYPADTDQNRVVTPQLAELAETDEGAFHEYCTRLKADDRELFMRFVEGGPEFAQLLHGVLGLVTESAELADAVKRFLAYGKPLDRTNLVEETGDIRHYLTYVDAAADNTPQDARRANVHKLNKRYGSTFSTSRALKRDVGKEQEVMKRTLDGDAV